MTRVDWAKANRACEALKENDESLAREIVTRLAEKWTLWTLAVLAEANCPVRFSRILALVEGVSQKSLTKVLRQLERDGLVERAVYAEVPPRVEYVITAIALDMLDLVHPLWSWAAGHVGSFQAANAAYDQKILRNKNRT